MVRTLSATLIAALSGALAAPPAFPQTDSSSGILSNENSGFGAAFETRFQLDAGMVVASGDSADTPLFDIDTALTVEGFTDAGRRYGLVAGGRIERDSGRRGWGGLAGDCPAGRGDCATGVSPASGYRSSGAPVGDATRTALEEAYLYYDTGWGELRFGYGPGAAQLDTAGGPAAFRLSRADGGRVATDRLSGARTANLASGWSPKILFRSVALGQESTIGTLRASASFTPAVRDCGVDVCHREYGPAGLVSPVFDDVAELGLIYAIRRGDHEIEASFGIASGADATGRPGFERLLAWDAGLSWRLGDWSAGLRGLVSDNGLAGDRGYQAWSASAGYEAGPWLFTLEYAGFSDDAVHVDGTSWQAGGSRLIGERWLAGVGLRNARRWDPVLTPGGRTQVRSGDTVGFLELGWQF